MNYFDLSKPLSGLKSECNGATNWILQSQENKKKVFNKLKNEIDCGNNPNEEIERIMKEENLNTYDLTPFDIQQLISEVEEYWRRS